MTNDDDDKIGPVYGTFLVLFAIMIVMAATVGIHGCAVLNPERRDRIEYILKHEGQLTTQALAERLGCGERFVREGLIPDMVDDGRVIVIVKAGGSGP